MTTVARTTPHSFFEAAFAAAAAHFRTARAGRARRIALITLMDMDASRLDDLGLEPGDIMEALAAPRRTNGLLAARRAERATGWTPRRLPAR